MSAAVFVRDPEARTANAVEAIKAFQAALEILPSDRDPMTWAQTQDNLGNAQTALAESQGDCEGKMPILTFAVDAYGKALTKEMREDLEWAKTQNNLGNALGCSPSVRFRPRACATPLNRASKKRFKPLTKLSRNERESMFRWIGRGHRSIWPTLT
jgi:tetratricopeptide (TPR) repeat protein